MLHLQQVEFEFSLSDILLELILLSTRNRGNMKHFFILGEYPQLPGQAPPMQSPVYVTGPPPVQQPAQQIAIVQGPIKYGKNPITITCPHCKSQVKTSIRSEPSSRGKNCTLTYLIFIYINIKI